jgi:hypothetical protein
MTLPDIIKTVQDYKDRTWEIRASNEWISKIEWMIPDVPVDVLQRAALFYNVVVQRDPINDTLFITPTVPGSMCHILIFSQPIK